MPTCTKCQASQTKAWAVGALGSQWLNPYAASVGSAVGNMPDDALAGALTQKGIKCPEDRCGNAGWRGTRCDTDDCVVQ